MQRNSTMHEKKHTQNQCCEMQGGATQSMTCNEMQQRTSLCNETQRICRTHRETNNNILRNVLMQTETLEK